MSELKRLLDELIEENTKFRVALEDIVKGHKRCLRKNSGGGCWFGDYEWMFSYPRNFAPNENHLYEWEVAKKALGLPYYDEITDYATSDEPTQNDEVDSLNSSGD